MAKYKKSEVGLIDTIRICHANNNLVNELMKTGTIEVKDEDKTWENLRSQGMSFKDIINTIKMPHMALLRNLRNIFKELTDDDRKIAINILNQLKDGVKSGKQFPFRYYSALKQIKDSQEVKFKPLIIDAIKE